MYSDEWQKIKTKVPLDLWKKVELLGFDSPDKAVINGLEKLCFDPEMNIYGKEQEIRIQELKNSLENEQKRNQKFQRELELRIEEAQKQNKNLQNEKQELEKQLEDEKRHNQELQRELEISQREFEIKMEETQKQIKNLQSENQELEKRQEEQKHSQEFQRELELRMEEAQRQIQDLQKRLDKAERREIYFEEMHNNYMMQMQTLINQKQIVAPGAKKPWWRFW
jgi:chromosome segregation ATPase